MLNSIKKKIIQNKDKKEIETILCNEDFMPVNNVFPNKINRVIFYLRRILPHSGGYTSILRLGTEIEKNGYDVYYAILSNKQSLAEAKKNASTNLNVYRGTVIKASSIESTTEDIIVATFWKTVYQIKNLKGYKMYFVQDFEPYFTVFGEEYLLALKTYELGFHMISLGSWNKYMIEKNVRIKGILDTIEFPFEPSEYTLSKRDYTDYSYKKEFIIAAFIKEDNKRIPNVIQNLLGNLEKEFDKNRYKLNIKYFGVDKHSKLKNGENLGLLNKEQLSDLYEIADFGICGSMTNVSLVPYEMLAKGLPLIEFEEGTYSFFFPSHTAIITNFCYKYLFTQLMEAIKSPNVLEQYHENALAFLKNLSWKKTGKQFVKVVEGCKNERG